jgi:exopolysaccharide production protein ExoZ
MLWSLQVLRFVAALMVVYVHAADTAMRANESFGSICGTLINIGHCGVDIFFVISGVIIAKIAPGRTPTEFIWSRIRRIVPLYFLFSIAALAFTINTGFGWREALATFLFWPATDQMTAPTLAGGWTLCFEMLFYAATALILLDRQWTIIMVGAYGMAFLLRPISPIFQFLGSPIILEFLLGVTIAYIPGRRFGVLGLPIGTMSLVGAALFGIEPIDIDLQRVLIFGLPSAMIVYGTLQITMRESVWTYLGDASYSLYLSHFVPLTFLLAFSRIYPIPSDLLILIGIFTSLLFAWRVHERFEKPMMNALKGKLLTNKIYVDVSPNRRSMIPINTASSGSSGQC